MTRWLNLIYYPQANFLSIYKEKRKIKDFVEHLLIIAVCKSHVWAALSEATPALLLLSLSLQILLSIYIPKALLYFMRTQTQKCSLKIQKREHCSLYIPSGWSLKNIINPRHNGWDWDKCPIKNRCAASAPWTVQCIYQCKQCSKAPEIPDRGRGFQPTQTSGRSQIRQTPRQGGLYFYLQHSSLPWRENARGVMHIASMLKGGDKIQFSPPRFTFTAKHSFIFVLFTLLFVPLVILTKHAFVLDRFKGLQTVFWIFFSIFN